MTEESQAPEYEGPAIVELMGHRVTAGYVREVSLGGAQMLRVDTPQPDGAIVATQYYGSGSVYCLTPVSEEAMQNHLCVQRYDRPEPVRLALPNPAVKRGATHIDEDDDEELF